jgi:hypothetical protein
MFMLKHSFLNNFKSQQYIQVCNKTMGMMLYNIPRMNIVKTQMVQNSKHLYNYIQFSK